MENGLLGLGQFDLFRVGARAVQAAVIAGKVAAGNFQPDAVTRKKYVAGDPAVNADLVSLILLHEDWLIE